MSSIIPLIKQYMGGFQAFYKCICCIDERKYPSPYNFDFTAAGGCPTASQFQSNHIRTSKYRWYDFLVKALLLQYRRMANVYFLIIGILSSVPSISPVSSVTIWVPIIIVLSISLMREGYEDYRRYRMDEQLNHKMKVFCFQGQSFVVKEWSQLRTGDIVKVVQNQFVPADLILIASSQPSGNAFIQTASLDGQKNLKVRKAYNQSNKYNCEQLLAGLKGQWTGVQPDGDMHRFSSKMQLQQTTIQFEGDKQFLYRGARLKNTNWVYGLVVYTGRNTKIMMNLDLSHTKNSRLQDTLNRLLICIFLFQLLLCILPAVCYGLFRQHHQQSHYYIDWPNEAIPADTVLMFFSYIILMSTFIPISLIVSIQFVKVSQAYFINSDKLMFSGERQQGVTAKTFTLNQELGQVEYVFSDKTGTLTQNVMDFKIALIGNHVYGDQQLISKCGLNYSSKFNQPSEFNYSSKFNQPSKFILSPKQVKGYLFGKEDSQLEDQIVLRTNENSQQVQIGTLNKLFKEYFQLISMTHEVLIQKNSKVSIFRGPSPDQIALVRFAKQNSYEFMDSAQSVISIKVNGLVQSFQLLQTFSFTSERKRMSIVFRDQRGNIRLYIKGADNVIKQLLGKGQMFNLEDKIDKCSSIGLRTLLVGTKIVPESQYKQFKRQVSLLQGKQKQQKYQQMISALEKDLVLLGATAVLDKLQDMVPQTIKDLLKANIKVWMLTGDKLETAQNIAKSCNLIQKDFHIFKLSAHEITRIEKTIDAIEKKSDQLAQMKISSSLVIQGMVLSQIIGKQQLQNKLLSILERCQAVVCCRLLPLQKAQVVNLVKKRTHKIVLAIGDGENDVPMIKAANIGIGLFGEQGMGAVQASDYGMPEFRMLRRLLFVHGRWNYIRISDMILYFFYKNIIFTVPRLVFGFYSAFSSQRVFDDVYVALYNAVFTAVPVIIRAVLQQDLNYVFPIKRKLNGEQFQQLGQQVSQDFIKSSLCNDHPESLCLPHGYEINKHLYKLLPKIYFVGQQNCIFNLKSFIYWTFQAVALGILITVICLEVIGDVSINQKGWSSDLWLASLNLFTGLLIIVTLKLVTHTKYWSLMLVVSILVVSIGLYVAYMWFSNYKAILSNHILGTAGVMWQDLKSFLFQIFCICSILLVDGVTFTIDFHYGSYASKMRLAVSNQQQLNRDFLTQPNLSISQTYKESQHDLIIQHEEEE